MFCLMKHPFHSPLNVISYLKVMLLRKSWKGLNILEKKLYNNGRRGRTRINKMANYFNPCHNFWNCYISNMEKNREWCIWLN